MSLLKQHLMLMLILFLGNGTMGHIVTVSGSFCLHLQDKVTNQRPLQIPTVNFQFWKMSISQYSR